MLVWSVQFQCAQIMAALSQQAVRGERDLMDHPFEVGKMYRNRNGEYVVVAIKEPLMLIRYDDGTSLRTRIRVQKRIWENIQMEAADERERERRQAGRRAGGAGPRGSRATPRGQKAAALVDSDFGTSVAGTSWRARSHLGGLLAQELSLATPYEFQSYAVPRQPWVRIVNPDRYSAEKKYQVAKFVFGLDAEEATFGFYIERNDGPMDEGWHWTSMIAALQADGALRGELQAAMTAHRLEWRMRAHGMQAPVAVITAAGEALEWAQPGDESPEPLFWPAFVEWLGALDPDKWWNLWLVTSLPKAEALAAGLGVATAAVSVFRSLLPLYEASASLGRFAASG